MNTKKQILEYYLLKGKTIITVDGTQPGVKLPKSLSNQIMVKLIIKHKPKFNLTDECINTVLCFKKKKKKVVIPLSSIYHVKEKNSLVGQFFEEELPEQLNLILNLFLDEKPSEEEKYLSFKKESKNFARK